MCFVYTTHLSGGNRRLSVGAVDFGSYLLRKTGMENMTLEELKAAAAKRVRQDVWEWINGGTETEFTFQRNHLALEKIMLRLRVVHGLETARSLSTGEIKEIRKKTSIPFFLKGIMTVEDALEAVEAGVDAIVVSNHGGRVLDCCQASIEVLPEIVKAVGAKIEIFIDGGFRRGTDVLKALALGARGVLVGRPICWGLAAAGAEGVTEVLKMITSELLRTMVLTNVPDLNNVPRDVVVLKKSIFQIS